MSKFYQAEKCGCGSENFTEDDFNRWRCNTCDSLAQFSETTKSFQQPDECRAAFDKHYRPCLGSPDDVALDRGNAWHNFNAGWNARPIMRESSEVVSVEKIARMGINVSWEELPEDVRKQKLAYARDVIAAAGFIPVMPISLDKCVASYQASPHSASGNYSMRGCVIAVLEAAGVKYE